MSYVAEFRQSISAIGREKWDALRPDDNPFLAFDFLDCLERYGGAAPKYGWHPLHCVLSHEDQIVGVAPNYIKENSHGEFVFDWAWADAYERSGRTYYPKFLCAVPYTPVTGARLLTGRTGESSTHKRALTSALLQQNEAMELSSSHFNFVGDEDSSALEELGLLRRDDWQFHWTNHSYRDMTDMLETFRAKKRKNILQERRKVREMGFNFIWRTGSEISPDELQTAHDCYRLTFHYKGNIPVLSHQFFAEINSRMGEQVHYCLAYKDEKPVAAAIFFSSSTTLYGRYWGCYEEYPGLHFETCYYQGLEYCIDQQIKTFEPGAQGPHKISRGFLPTQTRSFHFVSDEGFRAAIAEFLEREKTHRADYGQELMAKSPYRLEALPQP